MMADYEQQLRAQGVPVDDWRLPSATDAEMDSALAPLGLKLPIEGRIWWGWHNGAHPDGQRKLFGPWQDCLSLEQAVEEYRQSKASAARLAAGESESPLSDAGYWWRPTWFPLDGSGQPIVIDCGVADDQPTPVRMIDWQNVEGFFKPRASSLGQRVAWWIAALEDGAWRWRPDRQTWEIREELYNPDARQSGLM
jgi:hypothetical protein